MTIDKNTKGPTGPAPGEKSELKTREQLIKEYEKEIEEYKFLLDQKKEEIEKQENVIQKKNEEIGKCEEELAREGKRIDERNQNNKDLTKLITQRNNEIKMKNEEINKLKNNNNRQKMSIKTPIKYLTIPIINYLIFAFCLMETNPMEWKIEERVVLIITSILISLIYYTYRAAVREFGMTDKQRLETLESRTKEIFEHLNNKDK